MSDAAVLDAADASDHAGPSDAGAAPDIYNPCGTTVVLTAEGPDAGDAGAGAYTYPIGPPPDPNLTWDAIDLFLGNTRLPRDSGRTNGWDYVDATHQAIEIFGPACDAIAAGTAGSVSVEFLCLLP
jgi:hypothetical protein